MPIYEYECPKCGRFDALQKMSSPALRTHEACGSKVRKVMSASAFAFKGSGFYVTDYKKGRDPAATTAKGDKPEKKAECAKASPKSEACASCPAGKSAA
jgi:putative FmdB family regulatory protein